MEPGLAFTLCGVGICFLIPAFILGFINRSKTTRCTVTTVATVKDILAKKFRRQSEFLSIIRVRS